MRPSELLAQAKPIIHEGMIGIQLARRAFTALIKDVESQTVSAGRMPRHAKVGLSSIYYNGTLYVRGGR